MFLNFRTLEDEERSLLSAMIQKCLSLNEYGRHCHVSYELKLDRNIFQVIQMYYEQHIYFQMNIDIGNNNSQFVEISLYRKTVAYTIQLGCNLFQPRKTRWYSR